MRIVSIITLVIVLTACSPEASPKESKPVNEPKVEETKENIIITEDEAVTFTIINTREVSAEELEGLKKEILAAYQVVKGSIDTDYTPAKNINIHLLKGNKPSTGYKHNIKLYANDPDLYPIVHEMTHTILGYGENFSSSRGYFTQEGFATYMESKYGTTEQANFGFSEHKIMKFLINREKNLPLIKLITVGYDTSYFRPVMNEQSDRLLQWMSYVHAGSFVTYLIDTYGIEKFERIYNQPDIPKILKEVYGKTVRQLENEWIDYIEKTLKVTAEEKEMVNNLDNLNKILGSIDKDLFKR